MNSMKKQKVMIPEDEPLGSGAQNATGEKQRNSSRKNEEAGSKQKWHFVVDVSGGENTVQCYKEHIAKEPEMLGPWKLEVVKQEMARVNIHILGISELKWTEWVNLTQVTIYLLQWETIP